MQAAINPALAQVIGAMDVISPVTPDGKPTVAAQVMQAAKQASMPQVAQQAGIAGQIQAMRMQEAQKALMNAAMQRQQPENVGIAPMAGQMQMPEGGVVGYSTAGLAQDNMQPIVDPQFDTGSSTVDDQERRRLEDEERRRRELQQEQARTAQMQQQVPPPPPTNRPAAAPAAPMAPPARGRSVVPTSFGSDQYITDMMAAAAYEPKMPTTQEGIAGALERRKGLDEYLRQRGSDPELIQKQIAQAEQFYGDRASLLERRRAAAESEKGMGGIAAFMRGFRQMKGEPIGSGFGRASDALGGYSENMRQRIERLEDLKADIEGLKIKEVNALRAMKLATDMGDFNTAMAERQKAEELKSARQGRIFEANRAAAGIVSGEGTKRAELLVKERENDLRSQEILNNRKQLELTREGNLLIAAQGRADAAMKQYSDALAKTRLYRNMPDSEMDATTRAMRDEAENQLKLIENNVLNPAIEARDRLYAKAFDIPYTPPPRGGSSTPSAGGKVSVTLKNGTSFDFPNQAAADAFKNDARARGLL